MSKWMKLAQDLVQWWAFVLESEVYVWLKPLFSAYDVAHQMTLIYSEFSERGHHNPTIYFYLPTVLCNLALPTTLATEANSESVKNS
jgi:hypothetical protein